MTNKFKKLFKKLRGRPFFENSENFNFISLLEDYSLKGFLGRGICQIGANDGVSNDPIHEFFLRFPDSRAVLVEPQLDAFEKLCVNYRNEDHPNFKLLNNAFNVDHTPLELYKIAPRFTTYLKEHYNSSANPSGVTSTSKSHVISFLLKAAPDYFKSIDPNDYVITINTNVLTVEQLFRINGDSGFDVYQIDAEGFDAAIVNAILDAQSSNLPLVVNFEYKNLSETDKRQITRKLGRNYKLYRNKGDLCAVKTK